MVSARLRTVARDARRPKRVITVLIIVFVLVGWWEYLRPTELGGDSTLVTVSGSSMEPGMHTGDLAVVRRSNEYEVGDAVAFRVPKVDGEPGGTVIHRIVGGDAESGFVMRGDNKEFDDPWQPGPEQITGELSWHIPRAGTVVSAMGDPLLAATGFAALTAFLVVAGGGRKDENDKVTEKALTRGEAGELR